MTTPDDLAQRFSTVPGLRFSDAGEGIVVATIDNAHATASLCLQGGHLMSWHPKSQAEPVVWLSRLAKLAPGKSIRGGVPVCWPWFGPHGTEAGFPAHGFARTVPWELTAARALPDGATELRLVLAESDKTRALWPHASRCEIALTVGAALRISLTTANLGATDFVIGEALHTYFRIGDIAEARVLGLEGCEYLDKVEGGARKHQQGAIAFAGETDRVYVDTEATCIIEDARLKRRIHVAKTGSRSTVVWTPWTEKADKMGDFGHDGWREMVCVESANASDNLVTVKAGASHRLAVDYSVERY